MPGSRSTEARLIAELEVATQEATRATAAHSQATAEWQTACDAVTAEKKRQTVQQARTAAEFTKKFPHTALPPYVPPPENAPRLTGLNSAAVTCQKTAEAAGAQLTAIRAKVAALHKQITGTPLRLKYDEAQLREREGALQQLFEELLPQTCPAAELNVVAWQLRQQQRLSDLQRVVCCDEMAVHHSELLLLQNTVLESLSASQRDSAAARATAIAYENVCATRMPVRAQELLERQKLELETETAKVDAARRDAIAGVHATHEARLLRLVSAHNEQMQLLQKHHLMERDAAAATAAAAKVAAEKAAAETAAAEAAVAAQLLRPPAAVAAARAHALLTSAADACATALGATQCVAAGYSSPIAKTMSKLRALEAQRDAALGMSSSVQAGIEAVTVALAAASSVRDETESLGRDLVAAREDLDRERAAFVAFRASQEEVLRSEAACAAATAAAELERSAAAAVAAQATTTALAELRTRVSAPGAEQEAALSALPTPLLMAHAADLSRGLAATQRLLDMRAEQERVAAREHAEAEHAAFLTRAAAERAEVERVAREEQERITARGRAELERIAREEQERVTARERAEADHASFLARAAAERAEAARVRDEGQHCCVCLGAPKTTMFLPCRHLCMCQACASALLQGPPSGRLCPMCRVPIVSSVMPYM